MKLPIVYCCVHKVHTKVFKKPFSSRTQEPYFDICALYDCCQEVLHHVLKSDTYKDLKKRMTYLLTVCFLLPSITTDHCFSDYEDSSIHC
jgi:hypothetical protein